MSPAFTQPGHRQLDGAAGRWAARVTADLKIASATSPRSLQHAVGPSELGTPCTRRLGYRLLDWEPKPNTETDPWPSMTGTAIHAHMAHVYGRVNERIGRQRFLIEHPVTLPHGVKGTLDLFDTDSGDVVDWKFPGPTRLKEYRSSGPGQQYRTQVHLYGLGMLLQGRPPAHVVIVFLPRSGLLDQIHVWAEPFDADVAVAALNRYQQVFDFHSYLDPENHPERWALLPTAEAWCTWCPWYMPGAAAPGRLGCPGHATQPEKKGHP